MQNLYEKVKDHFSRYMCAEVVYVSGDTLYLTHAAAESYGDGTVMTVRKSDIEKLKPADEGEAPTKEDPQATGDSIENLSYNQLKARVAELGLEVADQKKETLLAALRANDEKKED